MIQQAFDSSRSTATAITSHRTSGDTSMSTTAADSAVRDAEQANANVPAKSDGKNKEGQKTRRGGGLFGHKKWRLPWSKRTASAESAPQESVVAKGSAPGGVTAGGSVVSAGATKQQEQLSVASELGRSDPGQELTGWALEAQLWARLEDVLGVKETGQLTLAGRRLDCFFSSVYGQDG